MAFRALALCQSRVKDCGEIGVDIVGYQFIRIEKSGCVTGWNL